MNAPIVPAPQVAVSCRKLCVDDHDRVVALLTRNFPERTDVYWQTALDRLANRTAREGLPHYGYVLTAGQEVVGVLLMIFMRTAVDGHPYMRCNLSSWCVEAFYRSYGSLLVTMATRDKSVTYINISPERQTRATVEAQGFTRYVDGLFLCVPRLSRSSAEAAVCVDGDSPDPPAQADAADVALMEGHPGRNCLKFWCVTPTHAYPFIFVICKRVRNLLPTAHLVYCADQSLVAQFSAAIGAFLWRHRIFVLSMDADGPAAGLRGWYLADRMPKYFKGPQRPRLGDLAYTELPLFGA